MADINEIKVEAVAFAEDQITLTYGLRKDLREIGGVPVLRAGQLTFGIDHPTFPEARELYDLAHDVIRDVLAEFEDAGMWQPQLPFEDDEDEDEDLDDEEEGMGS